MTQTVEVYRLWPDGRWDTAQVEISTFPPLTFEVVESRAAQRHWLEIVRDGGPRPIQVGIYMPSFQETTLP